MRHLLRDIRDGAAVAAITVAAVAFIGFGIFGFATTISPPASPPQRGMETIYVVNKAPQYISNKTLRRDIPAWEAAANKDFAPVWHTPQVDLRLVTKAPAGSMYAVFKNKGPVQGALAFHDENRGQPGIVVYAGTGDYYGYSNSISFTHELFELLADPTISVTNQGYPYPYYQIGSTAISQLPGTIWAQEVSDAVESYAYRKDGVSISDFVTQNWFNDHTKVPRRSGQYDYMGVVQAPFTIARGGYSQYWNGLGWQLVENFKHAGRDADGFLKAEQLERG